MQIWWSVLVGGLAMGVAGCGTAPVADDEYPPWNNGVVGAVPSARDVRITLETDGTVFPVGESVTLYYRIENLRHAPLFIIRSGDYRLIRQKRFEVSATRIDGMTVSDPLFFPALGFAEVLGGSRRCDAANPGTNVRSCRRTVRSRNPAPM